MKCRRLKVLGNYGAKAYLTVRTVTAGKCATSRLRFLAGLNLPNCSEDGAMTWCFAPTARHSAKMRADCYLRTMLRFVRNGLFALRKKTGSLKILFLRMVKLLPAKLFSFVRNNSNTQSYRNS